MSPSELHVIAVYFNHQRYNNLRLNFERFKKHMQALGVTLHIGELQLGNMPFEVTEAGNPLHVQLRTRHELFHKENLINVVEKLSVRKNFPDYQYLAWIDADVTFLNENVITDTIQQLNRYKVIQMWEKAVDMGPDGTPLRFKRNLPGDSEEVVTSFAACYQEQRAENYQYTTATTWHPGYAWAMQRETWDALGGLLDISILGAGDHHMAWAFAGRAMQGVHGSTSENYKKHCKRYLERACEYVNGEFGFVPGTLIHHWHGRKHARKYVERWDVLVENNFEPDADLYRLPNGLLELTDRNPNLRHGIRDYFRQRHDDANTLA